MADDAQDRKLPASERKIRKARAQGQVARSQDLGHLVSVGAVGTLLVVLAQPLVGWLVELMRLGLSFDAARVGAPQAMTGQLFELSWRMLVVVLPLGTLVAALAVASGAATGGWNFSWQPLQPKLSKFDPIAGLGRMASKAQLLTLSKACGLALVLLVIAGLYLHSHLNDFARLVEQPLPAALAQGGDLVVGGFVLLLLTLAVFALVDVPLQRHLLADRLKMSVQEARQEHKDAEGNTEVKGKIKARMRQMARKRMLTAVPRADVVVMNPSHFAVALRYEEGGSGAPRVVAKGADLLALRIRDLATEAHVPVLQMPPLARALYAHCEIDQEIPAALFAAVAQVLAWVFQVRAALAAGSALPLAPAEVAVPPELDPLHRRARPGAEA